MNASLLELKKSANTTWVPETFSNLSKLLGECAELKGESPLLEKLVTDVKDLLGDLAFPLAYPGKSSQHRAALEKGTPTINGEEFKVSQDFITEAKKLSDFLDLDEGLASALINAGKEYEHRFELPAPESAVVIYFNEREAKLLSIQRFIQVSANHTLPESYVQKLLELVTYMLAATPTTGEKMFVERIFDTLNELKATQEKVTAILDGPTADVPYQHDIVEFVKVKLGEERKQMATILLEIVFNHRVGRPEMMMLAKWLRTSDVEDPVTLRLTVALLSTLTSFSNKFDPTNVDLVLKTKVEDLALHPEFVTEFNAEILDQPWSDDGMKGMVWLQWSLLVLFALKTSPGFNEIIGYREDRVERIAEQAVQMGAYRFAVDYLLGYRISGDLEYELSAEFDVLLRQHNPLPATLEIDEPPKRYPHFTDIPVDVQVQIEQKLEDTLAAFISRMSSLIRRMRYNEEDAIYQAKQAEQERAALEEKRKRELQEQQIRHQQQLLHGDYRQGHRLNINAALEEPLPEIPQPRRDTEALFLWVTVLFNDRPDAGIRFWGYRGGKQLDLTDRLVVFVRWGSDFREQGMIRSYFHMLSAIACGQQASTFAYDFLSCSDSSVMAPSRSHVASNQAPLCSWPALFGALEFYASNMRKSGPDAAATPPSIPDAEVELLRAFLRLCRTVVRYSISARTTLYENQQFSAILNMFNLLGCIVPVSLKASLLNTISAFCQLDDDFEFDDEAHAANVRQAVNKIACSTWAVLEQSQTLKTTSDLEALRQARPAGTQPVPTPKKPMHALTVGRTNSSGLYSQKEAGIVYEVEEIESVVETYPEMRAFVRLIATLIHMSSNAPALSDMEHDPVLYSSPSPTIPANLGETYRIPGVGPFIGFVLDHSFLKADQRVYRNPEEKWSVYALSLDAIERSLATMNLSTFASDPNATVANGESQVSMLRALVTHPGFEIAVRILCGSKLLDSLLQILDVGVDALNSATGDMADSVGFSVLSTLRILLRIQRIQDTLLHKAVPALVESTDSLGFPLNLPRSLTTLEQLLLTRRTSVVQIVTYINCIVSADVCLASVKILRNLSDSSVFNGIDDSVMRGNSLLTLNRLVSMIDSSEESVRILHGFINCLENEGTSAAESTSGALVEEAAKGFTSGLDDQRLTTAAQSIRIAIIDLLLANLSPSKPAPTIAHWLLGFDMRKPASVDLPKASERVTCLSSILNLMRANATPDADAANPDAFDADSSALLQSRPRLAERCYHLVYHLCSDPVTSEMTIRFLRSQDEFFYSQLTSIPATIVPSLQDASLQQLFPQAGAGNSNSGIDPSLYSPIGVYAQMHARAWFWRSTALDLHTLVLQKSSEDAKRMIEWLVGDVGQSSDGAQSDANFGISAGQGSQTFLNSRMRLMALFESLRQAYRDSSYSLRHQRRLAERKYLSMASSLAMDADDDMAGSRSGSYGSGADCASRVASDAALLNVDINSCRVSNERGCVVFDLHALVVLLRKSQSILESSGQINSTGARDGVYMAIRRLVIHCYFANQECELYAAYASALFGWKDIAEVIVTSAWDRVERGGRVGRELTAFQLLKSLVQVLSENDPVYKSGNSGLSSSASSWWIEAPTSEHEARHAELLSALSPTLALFTEKLSFEWTRSGTLARASLAMSKPGVAGQSRPAPAAADSQLPIEPLLDVWKQLVAAALTPAAQSSLPLRGNVYASMLHFLSGVRKLAAAETKANGSEASVSPSKLIATPSATKVRAKSRLVTGTLDVLTDSALGDRLLESACADAADASDAWKTVAFSLLDSLASLFYIESRPNRVVMYLARKNYFASYIGAILRREDQALQATLQAEPASLNPLYIYEAKLAFFMRLALRQDGAEKLIENGIVDVLTDCSFLDMKPSIGGDSARSSFGDSLMPARSERYHQLLMPALNLVLLLVTKIGRDNLPMWMKAARFVSQHFSVLEAILKEATATSQPLTIALLTEVKAVTALVSYLARQRAVIEREIAQAGSGHVGISTLHLSILALLPKFATSNEWTRRLQTTNEVERAQAQIPASVFDDEARDSAAATLGESLLTDIQHTVFGQQASELADSIVRNVMTYAQSVTERPLAPQTAATARPFRPAFAWPVEHDRESDYTPSVATLIAFVRRSLAQIERGRKARDDKLRLSKNTSAMPTSDLRKIVAASPYVQLPEELGLPQMRAVASALLAQQGQRIGSSLSLLATTLEQALVLMWRHLVYFTNSAAAAANDGSAVYASSYAPSSRLPTQMNMPTLQEQDMLRAAASIQLPPLLSQLSEFKLTEQELVAASGHNTFIQMLVRNMRDLILRDGSAV